MGWQYFPRRNFHKDRIDPTTNLTKDNLKMIPGSSCFVSNLVCTYVNETATASILVSGELLHKMFHKKLLMPSRTHSAAPRTGWRSCSGKRRRRSWSRLRATRATWPPSAWSSLRRRRRTPTRMVCSSWRPALRPLWTSTTSSSPSVSEHYIFNNMFFIHKIISIVAKRAWNFTFGF